jgi:hypothetical protein
MRLDVQRAFWGRAIPYKQFALAFWLLLGAILCARGFLQPHRSTVYPIFAKAGEQWRSGASLYLDNQGKPRLQQFRYSPAVAAVYAPFSVLSLALGGLLWRLLNLGAYLFAFAWAMDALDPDGAWSTPRRRALLWLLLVPLSVGSLNNAQSNPLVTGAMLLAVAGAARQHWNLVALGITVACLFKIYPIALGLLLVVAFPRQLGWRLAFGLLAGFALPFVLQRPDYVYEQYRDWICILVVEDRTSGPLDTAYRDLRLLLCQLGLPLSRSAYVLVQLGAALGAALVVRRWATAGWPVPSLLRAVFGLAVCWMLLCGPATESCTYILLAPVLAWMLLDLVTERQQAWIIGLKLAGFAILLGCVVVCWFSWGRDVHKLGVQPFATVLVLLALLLDHAHAPASN